MSNKFELFSKDITYYDYEKELQAVTDELRTSVDMRLTFDVENSEAYFCIAVRNDDGRTIDWEKTHYIPWVAAVRMLIADGVDVPAELLGSV